MIHSDENQIIIGDSFKPFSDVAGIQLVFTLVHLLLLEGRWLVELNLALFGATMHTHCTLSARTFLDDVLDDLAEFSGSYTMLLNDIVHARAIVVLLGLLGIAGVCTFSLVQ